MASLDDGLEALSHKLCPLLSCLGHDAHHSNRKQARTMCIYSMATKKCLESPGVVTHVFNTSALESEAGGSLSFGVSLAYIISSKIVRATQ